MDAFSHSVLVLSQQAFHSKKVAKVLIYHYLNYLHFTWLLHSNAFLVQEPSSVILLILYAHGAETFEVQAWD